MSTPAPAFTLRFLDAEPDAQKPSFTLKFLEDEPDAREPSAMTAAAIREIAEGRAQVDWREMDQAALFSAFGSLASVDPDLASQMLPEARARAKELLRERGALLFEGGGEPITETYKTPGKRRRTRTRTLADPDGLNRTVANMLGFVGGAGAAPITDLQGWIIRQFAGDAEAAREKWNRINALSADNRELYRFAYGDSSRLFEGAGSLLAWAGGANALLRGGIGTSVFEAGEEGLRRVPWYRWTSQPVRPAYSISPLSKKGLAVGAAFDAAAGAALGPEYVPSWMADIAGIDQSRAASAAEAVGIGLVFGTVLRELTKAATLKHLRQRPEFAEFRGSDAEFRDHLYRQMQEWDAQRSTPRNVTPKPERPIDPARRIEPEAPTQTGSARERFEARMETAQAEQSAARAMPTEPPHPASVIDDIDYAHWETGGGTPGIRERVDPNVEQRGISPALRDVPNPSADSAAEILVQHPVIQVPRGAIAARPDVMQFKRIDESESGVNQADKLDGQWDDRKAGVLLLWQPADPAQYGLAPGQQYIVANGHHRYEFGMRNDVQGFNSQIIREVDGWSATDARAYAAEINIADGKGTIYDQAKFFRNTAATHGADEALARARQAGARGRKSASIGLEASDPVFDAFTNERIHPDLAAAIATAGRGDDALQLAILKRALERGITPGEVPHFAASQRFEAGHRTTQIGLFGEEEFIDTARLEKRSKAFEDAIQERMRAVSGAVKRPELAKKMGVDIDDPAALQARLNELQSMREQFDPGRWYLDDEAKQIVPGSIDPEQYITERLMRLNERLDDPNQAALFEPESVYNANRRLNELEKIQARRPLTPLEHDEIETLQRTLGQEFFDWLDDVKNAEAAMAARRTAEEMQAAMAARQQKRLVGGEDAVQNELFGPADNQLELFEAATNYLRSRGLPIDSEITSRLVQSVNERRARQRTMAADAIGQLFFDFAERVDPASGRNLGGSGDGLGGLFGREQSQSVDGFSFYPAPELIRIRETAFVHELIGDGIFRHVGAQIDTAEDLAIIARNTLRNPRMETFYVVPVTAGRAGMPYAVSSRVPYAANVLAAGDDLGTIQRFLDSQNADGYYMLHNHPSGNTSPSSADMSVTATFADKVPTKLLGHVIINHDNWTLINHAPVGMSVNRHTIPNAGPDPLRQSGHIVGSIVDNPEMMQQLAKRLEGPEAVTVFFRGRQNQITAVGSIAVEDLGNAALFDQLHAQALRHGGSYVHLYRANWDSTSLAHAQKLMAADRVNEILSDAGSYGYNEHKKNKWMGKPYDGLRVMEDPEPPPNQPLLWMDENGKARPGPDLGMMDRVKLVQMPELVQLARQLTNGALPKLKNLPKAHGLFRPQGNGVIVLNKRSFADPRQIARTLAHEIGHLVDYLPDQTMQRGNLLGRIASLNNFITTTLPKLEKNFPDAILTTKDRSALRREAEREIGKRPPKDKPDDLAAWQHAVAMRYKDLVQDAIEARGLVTVDAVRHELLTLSELWRGSWADTAPSYQRYRESSKELYADALSVMLNDPQMLREMAPRFWELFFNYLGRKPEVEQTLLDLYDFLHRGEKAVLRERQLRLRDGFARGDEVLAAKARERQLQRIDWRGLQDRILQEYHDVYWPMIRRANQVDPDGTKLKWHEDPRNVFSAHPLHENRIYRWLDRLHTRVVKPIEDAGISTQDMGEYLFFNRVLNETFVEGLARGQIANPYGIQPAQARTGLLNLRLQLGMDKMELLERGVRDFQDMFFDLVTDLADVGFISRQRYETEIKPNKYNYATFAVVDRLAESDYIPAGLKKQFGTLSEIANPVTSMILKAITMHRAAEMQRVKLHTRDFLSAHFPEDFTPGEIIRTKDGKLIVKDAPDGRALVTYLNDGRIDGFYTDPYIAKMFDHVEPEQLSPAFRLLNYTFREGLYKMYIQYSPPFLLFTGPVRDFRRTWQNLPLTPGKAATGSLEGAVMQQAGRINHLKLFGNYWRSWADASARMRGEMTPLVREMMDNYAFGSPYDTWTRSAGTESRSDYYWELLRKYHLAPGEQDTQIPMMFRPVAKMFSGLNYLGQTIEQLSRISAYRVLTRDEGWQPPVAARFVREHVGTPPFWRRGTKTAVANAVLPFFNVAMKGYSTDLKLMKHPDSRAGWWARWALSEGVWTTMQWAAGAGLLGAGVAGIYQYISRHDRLNTTVIPLGFVPEQGAEFGGRAMYLRLPRDETSRMLSAMLYTTLDNAHRMTDGDPRTGPHMGSFLNYAGGQLPGIHPLVDVSAKWYQYLSGQNPRDSFTGSQILSNDEWLAGGIAGTGSMIAYTVNQAGVQSFFRYNPHAQSTTEFIVTGLPVISSAVRLSDAGKRQQQSRDAMNEDRVGAQLRLAMDPVTRGLLDEHARLRSIRSDRRSEAQQARYEELRVWHSRVYRPVYEAAKDSTLEGEPNVSIMLQELRWASEPFVQTR